MEHLSGDRRRANTYLGHSLAAWHEWSFERGGRPPHEWLGER